MAQPKRYTKKPITISAMELTSESATDALAWINPINTSFFDVDAATIRIKTLEGDMDAVKGDFIIMGVKGEFYPCKPDIFWISYTEATS